ncbi:adenylate/guanylate cyclase domain-containing protein [Cellulomonas sp. Root137]|uniref:adenylate/guanylate cyclase domain-containing protein n=1 Tax=Cellulomonas sp. Root137 TaxID=1736459 RepID=UPI0006F34D4B|nr:adenylate/guanylate cyclase domain-containing protein [Cellulomonas sp. Root137]KQY47016.1 hypothetical protein ASD18_06450 [Cellulomonas sp. Root137]
MRPETRFTKSDDVYVAYSVLGVGDRNVVVSLAGPTHLEAMWEIPELAGFLEQLSTIARVAVFDKRGVGLSDRVSGDVDVATGAADIIAVMDAAEFETAVLVGGIDGGLACLAAAALYPERVLGIVGNELVATFIRDEDHPYGLIPETVQALQNISTEGGWGEARTLDMFGGQIGRDARVVGAWQRWERMAATPTTAAWSLRSMLAADARPFLADVHVPVLLLHVKDVPLVDVRAVHWLADHLEDARVVELGGSFLDLIVAGGPVLDELEDFLLGTRVSGGTRRELVAMLVTDLCGSTETAARVGEDAWRRLLEDHRRVVREALTRHGGREIDTAGDGFLATFRLASQAMSCAADIRDRCQADGVAVRQGVHAGEVSLVDGGVAGQAVHATARVAALAAAGEVLVSDTALMLAPGHHLPVEPAGTRTLRGLPGRWRLHRLGVPQ